MPRNDMEICEICNESVCQCDTFLCQVCGQIKKGPSEWRTDIAPHPSAANVCPSCVRIHNELRPKGTSGPARKVRVLVPLQQIQVLVSTGRLSEKIAKELLGI